MRILIRLICQLLACCPEEHSPCCGRCGTYFYDHSFVQLGHLRRIFPMWRIARVLARFRRFLAHRCEHCNRWMHFSDERVCSATCAEDRIIPF
jgi:hypothetical protein